MRMTNSKKDLTYRVRIIVLIFQSGGEVEGIG